MLKLYSYWRSSAAYRVRIGLNLKGLAYETVAVNIAPGADAQKTGAYRAVNPQGLVPTLEDGDFRLGQSLAILSYIDTIAPEPPFLPEGAQAAARARQIALAIATDIHPLNNLRVLGHLGRAYGQDQAGITAWYHTWLEEGLGAVEALLAAENAPRFALTGERPSVADICIVPQLYNARRWAFDLAPYRHLRRVEAACLALPAFADAAPEAQTDAPKP